MTPAEWVRVIAVALFAALFVTAMGALAGGSAIRNPVLDDVDFPYYAAAVVLDAGHSPDFVAADFLPLLRRGASLYVALFRGSIAVGGGTFDRGLVLLRALLLLVYLPSMAYVLRRFGASHLSAVCVAAISTAASGFAVTGARWGILTTQVPLVMVTALATLIVAVSCRSYEHASAEGSSPPRLGATLAQAVAVSGLMLVVNPITGLAFAVTALFAVTLLHGSRRRFDARPLLFGLVCVLTALATFMNLRSAGGQAEARQISRGIRYGQANGMVFPYWEHPGLALALGIASAACLAALAVVVFSWWRGRGISPTRWRIFTVVTLVSAVLLLRAGLVPILIAAHLLTARRASRLEKGMMILLATTLCLGPLQQIVLLSIWRATGLVSIGRVLFDSARLMHFAYVPFYALLAVSIDGLAHRAGSPLPRRVVVIGSAVLVALQLGVWPLERVTAPMVLLLTGAGLLLLMRDDGAARDDETGGRVVVALTLAGTTGAVVWLAMRFLGVASWRLVVSSAIAMGLAWFSLAVARRGWRPFAIATVVAIVAVGAIGLAAIQEPITTRGGARLDSLSFAVNLTRTERMAPLVRDPCDPHWMTPDHVDMMRRIRAMTSESAVFFVANADRSFRVWARRSMLPPPIEYAYPIDGAPVSKRMSETIDRIWALPPADALRLAAGLGMEYGLVCRDSPIPEFPLVYANSSYAFYRLSGMDRSIAGAPPEGAKRQSMATRAPSR